MSLLRVCLSRPVLTLRPQLRLPARLLSNETKAAEVVRTSWFRLTSQASTRLMPFEEYINTKKKLAPIFYVTAFPFTIVGLKLSMDVIAYTNPDMFNAEGEPQLIYGMDPMFVVGTAGFFSAVAAYFVGLGIVRATWNALNKKTALALRMREDDFQRRLMKYRTVGAKQSDDYYGDKIKTLHDYRKWLHDQRKAAKSV